jgi:2-keto-3-deoxy-L-rhamnonate aldolase RhmA
MIPRVTGPEQVHQAIRMMKYPPLGMRGNALSRGYTRFKSGSVREVMDEVNRETMLIVQVETRAALENLEAIVTIPGVDAVLIGPTDLSIALDVAGQLNSPPMQAAIAKTIAACRQAGVIPAIHINALDLAVYWAKQGMRLISSSSETGLMMNGGQAITSALTAAFE